jgi:acetyl-CoA carboxylase carboxyl transferase subunit beta
LSWLSNFVRPKIQALINKKEVPENLWDKCPACEKMIFRKDLEKHLHVCPHCEHHLRLNAVSRLQMLFDNQAYEILSLSKVMIDPLKFKDRKKYTDRLKEAKSNGTNVQEAIQVAEGLIEGINTIVAAFDFTFIGGSMGIYVGEAIIRAAEYAVQKTSPLIIIPASGGARMQEGVLSLMQMARTTVAINMVKNAKLPYIVVFTDPTTGGVSASFAMLGDIHISEPKATIGFTGARVIEQTMRQKLPEGFQTAEYLLEHGMVDMVVHRKELKKTLGRILNLLTKHVA